MKKRSFFAFLLTVEQGGICRSSVPGGKRSWRDHGGAIPGPKIGTDSTSLTAGSGAPDRTDVIGMVLLT
jgi:hypothetical protein